MEFVTKEAKKFNVKCDMCGDVLKEGEFVTKMGRDKPYDFICPICAKGHIKLKYTVKDDKKEKWQSVEVNIKIPSLISNDKEFSHKSDDVIYTFYTHNVLEVDSIVNNFKNQVGSFMNRHRSTIVVEKVEEL